MSVTFSLNRLLAHVLIFFIFIFATDRAVTTSLLLHVQSFTTVHSYSIRTLAYSWWFLTLGSNITYFDQSVLAYYMSKLNWQEKETQQVLMSGKSLTSSWTTAVNPASTQTIYQFHGEWGTTDIQSCPIKLPPVCRAPAVWVIPVWLIRRLMREWCHLYVILIELLQQKYVQYISIICSCCC